MWWSPIDIARGKMQVKVKMFLGREMQVEIGIDKRTKSERSARLKVGAEAPPLPQLKTHRWQKVAAIIKLR